MRLSPSRFNSFLHRIGQNLSWRSARDCPCADTYSGSPDPDCDFCDGTGHRWTAPISTFAGIVSRDIARQYAPMAPIDAGDVMLVIPSDEPIYAIAEFDRVVMTDRTEHYSVTKTRGRLEKLRFDPLTVDHAEWLDDDAIVNQLPTSFDRNGAVWASGGPPQGAAYALTGTRRPEFYCYLNLPLDRPHQGGDPLPRRVVLRRFDLLAQ